MKSVLLSTFIILFNIKALLSLDTCVSKSGSKLSGCSTSGNCCSSMSALVEDVNSNCQHLPNFNKLNVELRSDFNLINTVHFGKFCNRSVSLCIKGNNYIITCSNKSQGIRRDSGSGLYFNIINGISLMDITFLNCGSFQNSTSQNVSSNNTCYLFPATLYFLNCSDVNMTNITVRNGHGIGVALFDTVGSVNIINCSFENNRVIDSYYPGGGGLYIEFTNCTPGYLGNCHHTDHKVSFKSQYKVENCAFENNYASLVSIDKTGYKSPYVYFQGLGKGGGMAVYFNGDSTNHTVQVLNCVFHDNSAVFGGGIFFQYRDTPLHNSLTVENCNFSQNNAYVFGGGGASGGFVIGDINSKITANNTITFRNCTFEENYAAGNGGGVSLFVTKALSSNFSLTNKINLVKCLWKRNRAFVASALDLAPEVYSRLGRSGLLPIPVLDNCTFDSNSNKNNNISNNLNSDEHFTAVERGLATVYISGFEVDFKGDMYFINNSDTGLYLSLASVHVTQGSNLHFERNHGKNGGGITMVAFSVLFIYDNCTLTFKNNTSYSKGGAILVHSIDNQHEAHFSHSCFIQFRGNSLSYGFKFDGNVAKSHMGNVIFATSFAPCDQESQVQSLLKDIRNNSADSNCHDIGSPAMHFSLNFESVSHIIPGKEIVMNISATDEFNQQQNNVVYEAYMTPQSSNIEIDPAYTQISNNTIKFLGNHLDNTGKLKLETETATLTIKISLSKCPPGFQNNGKFCECSTLQGIAYCEGTNSSSIIRGFWIGQCNGGNVCTAHCPPGYCTYAGNPHEVIHLPSSIHNLSSNICDEFRTDILCSKCKNGTSSFYHSPYYRCQSNRYCDYGVIFYLLSEILPLTIVFFVVTIFNISLTSGAMNGFVLFAQISDSIHIDAQGSIVFPELARMLTSPYHLIYRMFNFDFFSLEALSFCLWKSATALDMMAVKYFTITYALCLLLLTVFVLNSWKCKLLCIWFRPKSLRNALTHGFTTLLTICFSQCARVCFLILHQTQLLYINHQENVVFYNGALHPFKKGHVQYAIPAVLFLTFLVLIPLVWLLLYPLLFKILAKCHLNESKISHLLSKLFPIELLDSFQGCYKDNCRYFAGLYFLYRLVPLILSTTNRSQIAFYTLVSVQVLCMLTLHSLFQPYRNHSHNLIDSLIFANLLLVNLLTAYNYMLISSESHFSNGEKSIVVYTQLLLMYLPLVYIVFFCARKVYRKLKQYFSGYFKINEDLEDLPPLRNVSDSSVTS